MVNCMAAKFVELLATLTAEDEERLLFLNWRCLSDPSWGPYWHNTNLEIVYLAQEAEYSIIVCQFGQRVQGR